MSRPGDIAARLASAGGPPALELRLGVVRSVAGNTMGVDIAGAGAAVITGPMFLSSGYVVGMAVALLGTSGRWLVLGQVTIP
ncbi:MAG: hypothetical protein ACRCZP_16755 [Phycicoccus sp.]